MQSFTRLSSPVIPLPLKDIDTDLIIPAQYLTSTSRSGYGENLFRRLRDSDPNFPLNLPQYKGAQILVTDNNFGCGSSREHAVWALLGAGIKVVICKSFADIFFANSAKNGLLLVSLTPQTVDTILAKAQRGSFSLSVDLEKQTVSGEGIDERFSYDPFRRHCLLNGLDDLDYLLSHQAEISAYRQAHEAQRFFSAGKENN